MSNAVTILAGARSPADLIYRKEVDRWRRRGDVTADVIVDHAGPDWTGPVGVVTALLDRLPIDGPRTVAMICGPEVMMRFALSALERRGVRRDRVYLSMERNMQCGVGHCGHCQLGPTLVCRDGPVYSWSELDPWLRIREL